MNGISTNAELYSNVIDAFIFLTKKIQKMQRKTSSNSTSGSSSEKSDRKSSSASTSGSSERKSSRDSSDNNCKSKRTAESHPSQESFTSSHLSDKKSNLKVSRKIFQIELCYRVS